MDNYIKKHDNFNTIEEIKKIDESDWVTSMLLLKDGRLASCTFDNFIRIYNMNNNFECELSIKTDHNYGISDICELENKVLVSSSYNGTIKIHNFFNNQYSCEATITEHSDPVCRVIPLTNNRFASCSRDSLINIYNSKYPYNLIRSLFRHNNSVLSIIQLKGKECLASISIDYTFRFWNLLTYQNDTIIGIDSYSECKLIENDNKIFIAEENRIKIIDTIYRKILKIIRINTVGVPTSIMHLDSNSILVGSESGNLYLLNFNSSRLRLVKIRAHNNKIKCMIKLNNGTFASCSSDNSIKIWKNL